MWRDRRLNLVGLAGHQCGGMPTISTILPQPFSLAAGLAKEKFVKKLEAISQNGPILSSIAASGSFSFEGTGKTEAREASNLSCTTC